MFKKISQALCLLRLWLIMLISKRNQCAQGSSNSQQNCQCHLNIVILAQIHTWNLSILVHHRIISDLTYLLLDHDVLYYGLFEFYFWFTKKYVFPSCFDPPITSSLQILSPLFPPMSRGLALVTLSGHCQTKVHNSPCIQWKEICGWRNR